ncbi:DCN1-like protein 3 [Oopsacas minuta]|uniref:Defective in cullin neddylation protein n=1 Tax=Oopsacas minuta TaxID=111878 RepID=A0AAV7JW93_9METZ|nr:DCN1-like protein 3 [Oopsacas minuta]
MGQNSTKPKKTQLSKPQVSEQIIETIPEMDLPVRSKKTSTPPPQSSKGDSLESFFLTYKDSDSDQIMAGGVERFCNDLKVDPTDFIVLAIAWKFNADQMCMFTREQFITGCSELNVHNIKEFRKMLPTLKSETSDKSNFKKLYYFTFQFGLEQGQRTLPIEMAVPLWQCVFLGAENRPKLLDDWLTFLQESSAKFISKDTWNMFYYFIETVQVDLSNYDETDAWPTLFDDFYEFQEDKKNTKTA